MKKLLMILMILIAKNSSAQNDSSQLYRTFILHILIDQSDGIIDLSNLKHQYENVETINGVGFKDLIFLSFNFDKLTKASDHQNGQNNQAFTCNYIIAYNKNQNKIYHLKGFKENDFKKFYYFEMDRFEKKQGKPEGKLDDVGFLRKKYNVEGLDFLCLYQSIILNKPGNRDCTISCAIKDKSYGISR